MESQCGGDKYLKERVIMAAENVDVEAINNAILNRLPGETIEVLSSDSLDPSTTESALGSVPLDVLNNCSHQGCR